LGCKGSAVQIRPARFSIYGPMCKESGSQVSEPDSRNTDRFNTIEISTWSILVDQKVKDTGLTPLKGQVPGQKMRCSADPDKGGGRVTSKGAGGCRRWRRLEFRASLVVAGAPFLIGRSRSELSNHPYAGSPNRQLPFHKTKLECPLATTVLQRSFLDLGK
jgi:hypothetical protein